VGNSDGGIGFGARPGKRGGDAGGTAGGTGRSSSSAADARDAATDARRVGAAWSAARGVAGAEPAAAPEPDRRAAMIGNLSRRERNLIGLAALGLAIVLGWEFVIQPVRDRNRAEEELIPAREQTFARRRDLLARRDTIASELQAVNARIDALSGRLLQAGTPAEAASELQNIAKAMASQATTEIRSERILTPVERGELLEIPIEIAVSGEIRQLVDLLARLDAAPKFLTIQDLKIRVVNVSSPKELLATLTLSGYIGKTKT